MAQKQISRTYFKRFIIVMITYAISLLSTVWLTKEVLPLTRWNILLALVPVLPLIYAIWAFSQFLDGIDELQRAIQFKAIAVASGLTAVLTFSYGLLESLAHLPPINLTWVFPLMVVIWGIATAVYGRQYR